FTFDDFQFGYHVLSALFECFFCANWIIVYPGNDTFSQVAFFLLFLPPRLDAVYRKGKYSVYFLFEVGRIIPFKVMLTKLAKMFGRPGGKLLTKAIYYFLLMISCVDND